MMAKTAIIWGMSAICPMYEPMCSHIDFVPIERRA
jgi:hypothetical protein